MPLEMRIVAVGGFGLLRDPQHLGRVAAVKAEILVQLDRCEIARMLVDDGVANRLHRDNITGDPSLQLAHQHRLARRRAGRHGTGAT